MKSKDTRTSKSLNKLILIMLSRNETSNQRIASF